MEGLGIILSRSTSTLLDLDVSLFVFGKMYIYEKVEYFQPFQSRITATILPRVGEGEMVSFQEFPKHSKIAAAGLIVNSRPEGMRILFIHSTFLVRKSGLAFTSHILGYKQNYN